jgi:RNase P subunit RPR2
MMLALFDSTPRFCPGCGKPITIGDTLARNDYLNAHCTFVCNQCQTHYQYVDREAILEAADQAGGDMKFNADRGWL